MRKPFSRPAKALCTVGVFVLIFGIAAGCSPQSPASSNNGMPADKATEPLAQTGFTNNADWAETYPDQYNSYNQPQYNRSHANMNQDLYLGGEVGYYPFCIACKSTSDYNVLWDNYGDGMYAFYQNALGSGADAMDTLTDDEQAMVSELWDCESCHDADAMGGNVEDMRNSISAKSSFFNNLGKDFAASLNPKEAVCGQCHNILPSVMAVPNLDTTEGTALSPYRYGVDADAMLKATMEDGGQQYTVDEDLGVVKYKGNHAIVEMFQGSVHQSMGLTCVDCHMPKTENENGEPYTSHDASGSITNNNVKLETCLNCHNEEDGVTSVLDMFYFLRRQSTILANAQGDAQGSLDDLLEAIRTATENGVDQATIDAAKEAYTTASWYIEYGSQTYMTRAYAPADGRGMAAAHDFDEAMELSQRAEAICKDAVATLV